MMNMNILCSALLSRFSVLASRALEAYLDVQVSTLFAFAEAREQKSLAKGTCTYLGSFTIPD
jgi:hypothetical protein